jgi:hypothetical protein
MCWQRYGVILTLRLVAPRYDLWDQSLFKGAVAKQRKTPAGYRTQHGRYAIYDSACSGDVDLFACRGGRRVDGERVIEVAVCDNNRRWRQMCVFRKRRGRGQKEMFASYHS